MGINHRPYGTISREEYERLEYAVQQINATRYGLVDPARAGEPVDGWMLKYDKDGKPYYIKQGSK